MRIIHCQRGVAALEFALVLPFLLLITFIIIEFGFILYDKAVLTNASREGARAGVVYTTDDKGNYDAKDADELKQIVKNFGDPLLINLGASSREIVASNIKFFCKPTDSTAWSEGMCTSSNQDLKVQVLYTYDFLIIPSLFALTGSGFDGTVPMSAETVMRME